jgi:NAD-dependent DNA ligase
MKTSETTDIKELKKQIVEANKAYRTGDAIMSDYDYDKLVEELEELSPKDELLTKIGHTVADESRKRKLPIVMASMNKIKTFPEFKKWLELKGIPLSTMLVITPKYDGISLCVDENKGAAITRGDGEYGQEASGHLALMCNKFKSDFHSFGEVIMSRKNFEKIKKDWQKFGLDKEPKNPRNLVGGKMNDKKPNDILTYCDYIRYGLSGGAIYDSMDKSKQLSVLNGVNKIKVQFLSILASEVTADLLTTLFHDWSVDYELDGVIVEVDEAILRKTLGRETSSNNPCFARAFKGNFEMVKESVVTGITWQISKLGYLKPVAQIEPIELDGATVTNVTGVNGKFVSGYGLKKGSKVSLKRSGMIIPLFLEIDGFKVQKDKSNNYIFRFNDNKKPVHQCPVCGSDTDWNENNVEVICTNSTCDGSKLKVIISFFEIMEVDGVSEGLCEIFYDAGYDTIEKILKMSEEDMLKLEGFADRKAEITYKNIHAKMSDVSLSKLQHASGLFFGLGSKKLKLLEHFKNKPTISELCSIEGFSEKSAQFYLDGIDKFNSFIKKLPITIKKESMKTKTNGQLSGQVYVFTGVRRADLEQIIEQKGGAIGSGVSKNTTCLVMKEKGSGSSKEQKAVDLGIRILTVGELEKELS